jgi:hypothetical protein
VQRAIITAWSAEFAIALFLQSIIFCAIRHFRGCTSFLAAISSSISIASYRNKRMDLVRPELRDELHTLLSRAFEQPTPQLSPFISLAFSGTPHRVAVLVQQRSRKAGGGTTCFDHISRCQ